MLAGVVTQEDGVHRLNGLKGLCVGACVVGEEIRVWSPQMKQMEWMKQMG